jgi:hypothetical protein
MDSALYVAAGNRGQQSLMTAGNFNISASRLYVTDRLTKTSFLVDTDTDLCLYPRSRLRERRIRTSYEFAANGSIANTYGCIKLHLDLGLRGQCSWRFVVADITGPIIGSDFLSFYSLLVDIRHRRLFDNVTNLTFSGAPVRTDGGRIKVLAGSSRYDTMLLDFPDIIRPEGVSREHRHSTEHHIHTTPGPPVT